MRQFVHYDPQTFEIRNISLCTDAGTIEDHDVAMFVNLNYHDVANNVSAFVVDPATLTTLPGMSCPVVSIVAKPEGST